MTFAFKLQASIMVSMETANKNRKRWILCALGLVLAATPHLSQAAFTPVGISILPPLQFPPADFNVVGARASLLWGRHRQVFGLDVGGLGNITELDFVGIGVAGFANWTKGSTFITGLQLAGGANVNTNKTTVVGLQAALGANYNSAESRVIGLQLAIANLSGHTSIFGIQSGIYNKAQAVYGFQIGLINVATRLHGVQIGLLNFNSNGIFSVSPIINVAF